MPTIRTEIVIQAPVDTCFDLFRDMSLHAASAGQTRERVIAGPTGLIGLGDEVTFEGVHFGIRQRFTARITEFEHPHRFVDEMVRGAFASMRHIHEFFPTETGTRVVDTILYTSPLGWLGRLADVLFLERHLRAFLEARNQFVRNVAETGFSPNSLNKDQ